MKAKLLQKRLRFVDEYMLDLNATQAALRAGYSARSAYSTGERLLRNAEVRAEIERRRKEQAEKFSIQADDVIRGLHEEATFKGKGAQHGARVTAWTQLGRHLALFVDKINVTVEEADAELAQLLEVDIEALPE